MQQTTPRSRLLRTSRSLVYAAIAAAVLMTPSQAAARDPVLAAIASARAKDQVTPAQAQELRTRWLRSARAARGAPSASRRASIGSVRSYVRDLARAGALTGPRLEPALLSVRATAYVMQRARFPAHEEELQIPGEAAIFTYYVGRGVQLQPFESFKQGMRMINQVSPDVAAARALADRMLELDVRRGSSTTWEFYFPFGGPSRPWTSSISQALATEFYFRVAELVPAAERAPYDAAAAAAAASFLRSPRAGGVGVAEGDGRFYVMYPFHSTQRILNGHLQVLINLNRYAEATGSAVARRVVELGVLGVTPILPRFDTGGWSNYQPGQEADLNYHEFQTGQLVKLGKELDDATFAAYGRRFTRYLESPPTLELLDSGWATIIPARDGYRDAVVVRYRVDKRARATMVVRDADGREVWRGSSWTGRGTGKVVWYGRNSNGRTVPDGDYQASFTSTDVAGNRRLTRLPAPLRVRRDTRAPELRTVTIRGSGTSTLVTVNARDLGSAWVNASIRLDGRTLASRRGPRVGTSTLRVPRPARAVQRADLVLRDSSGNSSTWDLSGDAG